MGLVLLFQNCGYGCFNNMGDFHCYNNVFLNSTTADCSGNNLGHFALVGNNSFGSTNLLETLRWELGQRGVAQRQ